MTRQPERQQNQITVIGAGFMGTVIATIYARHGYDVVLHDSNAQALASYGARAAPIAESLVTAGVTVANILERVRTADDLADAVAGSFMVHEVAQEDLGVKQALFSELDSLCGPDVVLATNTSSFLLTSLCEGVNHRERVVGIHYITPAHIIKAVEIIHADFTPPALIEWAQNFLTTIDHVGVVCRESPGFLVNRVQMAMLAEIHRMVDEGLATAADIDAAVRLSIGPRLALWGPLLTEDLVVHKKTALAVMAYMEEKTGSEANAPTATLKNLVADGKAGAISGEGWYQWSDDYDGIVRERDQQLADALAWFEQRDGMAAIGLRNH